MMKKKEMEEGEGEKLKAGKKEMKERWNMRVEEIIPEKLIPPDIATVVAPVTDITDMKEKTRKKMMNGWKEEREIEIEIERGREWTEREMEV